MHQNFPLKRATKLTEIMDTLMESIESNKSIESSWRLGDIDLMFRRLCRIKKVEADLDIFWLGAGAFSLDCGYCARTLGGVSEAGAVHLGAERAVEWAVRRACREGEPLSGVGDVFRKIAAKHGCEWREAPGGAVTGVFERGRAYLLECVFFDRTGSFGHCKKMIVIDDCAQIICE